MVGPLFCMQFVGITQNVLKLSYVSLQPIHAFYYLWWTKVSLFLGCGADITFEADSGYSPVALAVALGHKKGKSHSQQYINITNNTF